MMHLRKFLWAQQIGHRHASKFANATEVVALEVGDHDQLGDLFRVRDQFIGEPAVALRIPVARPRALDRLGENLATLDPQEKFRGSGEDLPRARVEKRTAWRGAAREQMLEKRVRISLESGGKTLRDVDLIDVTRRDALVHSANRGLVVGALHARAP